MGDAAGLILYKGVYHLFYMYDEWSRRRRFNKELGPRRQQRSGSSGSSDPRSSTHASTTRPGSGSGIVDWNNTLGLQSGAEKTLVVFYTDYGRGTSIAFSRDAGKTWIRPQGQSGDSAE